MEETRKGFRFTKKVVSSASAGKTLQCTLNDEYNHVGAHCKHSRKILEIVAFDDLNEEISSPVGKKRKPANENIRLEENSRRDTDHVAATVTVMLHSPTKSNATPRSPEKAASSSSRKMSRTETSPLANSKRATKQTKVDVITVEETKASVIKAYYPKIDYDPLDSFVIGKYQDPDMSHKDTLVKLVENICANECAGLKQYSDENNGRKSIIVYLQNILTRLPAEIANATSDSIIFSPELSGDEKYEIESLEQTVATLRQQSLALEKYDTDISELGKKYDMWIDGVPQNIAAASSGSVEKVTLIEFSPVKIIFFRILYIFTKNFTF